MLELDKISGVVIKNQETGETTPGPVPFAVKAENVFVGEVPLFAHLQEISMIYFEGEQNVTQKSHNAVDDEGGENTLDPLQVNITTGRSSFTNGQKNRNGAYFSIQTGQSNTQPRLFDMTFLDGSVVKKWRSAANNIVGGLGNFITAANGVFTGYTTQSAGSFGIIGGKNNKDWIEGATEEESEKIQASINAYKNYSLYGANEETGEIYGKNGAGTDFYLQDLQFKQTNTYTIMNGLGNNNRSVYSIINGSGNKNFANTSIMVGKNNTANTSSYSYDAGSKCHFIFGSENITKGSNIYSLGNNNNLIGNNIVALGNNCKVSDFNNVVLINGGKATRDNQVVIGGSSPSDWAKFSIGGGNSTATAFQVSDQNYVYITRLPIHDDNPVRLVDIKSGEFSASFSNLKSNGSTVITETSLLSEKLSPAFYDLKLHRERDKVKLNTFSALRLADISTHYQGSQLNTGAAYQALDVKFARIKMKATPGNDGGGANTGNGSTVILPDKITTNELNVKNITGTIDTLNTDNKNIIGAINELKAAACNSLGVSNLHVHKLSFSGYDDFTVRILHPSSEPLTYEELPDNLADYLLGDCVYGTVIGFKCAIDELRKNNVIIFVGLNTGIDDAEFFICGKMYANEEEFLADDNYEQDENGNNTGCYFESDTVLI